MLLLSFFASTKNTIVAHFNHHTRPSSDLDQTFVQNVSNKLSLPFFTLSAPLGPEVSEATARQARYDFLFQLSRKHQNAPIFTAHHFDDLLETIAINLLRGTGWRGLAPLSRPGLYRPFLDPAFLAQNHLPNPFTKTDLITLATQRQITFRADPTNTSDQYLRNRLRPLLASLPNSTKLQLFNLATSQHQLKTQIDQLLGSMTSDLSDTIKTPNPQLSYPRSPFIILPDPLSLELLRHLLSIRQISLTRPQLSLLLLAIRTYSPKKRFNLPKNRFISFTKTHFILPF